MSVHRALIALSGVVACIFAFTIPVHAQDEGDAILVLDASGSMWGQIEDEAKITIAKRVLSDLLDELPANRQLGLIAYGHNRKGDCGDIEELAPLGTGRTAIKAAVDKLNPKGKTPMAASVKLAAEKLKYTEKKATVILISDGIETCEPDPCGVAAALEAAGVDFTAHVIGFDVAEENAQAQLRCIAENTGGQFVAAANASELSAALEVTVVEAPKAPQATNLRLRATELKGGVLIEDGLTWTVRPVGGGDLVLDIDGAGEHSADIAPGIYDIYVERPEDGLKGEALSVEIRAGASKTVTIALEFAVDATIRVEPENQGVAGTDILIFWTGPERQGDYVSIAAKEASAGSALSYDYISQGNPRKLRLPIEPGDYEIRYVLGRPYRTLVAIDYRVIPATASVSAPTEALAGETVTVAFTGPPVGAGDFITVTAPDAEERAYNDYAYVKNGNPAKIRMPLDAGDYEIRYVQGNNKVIARQAISVSEASSSVVAKTTAVTGETVAVTFTGPEAGAGDFITVTAPDAEERAYNDYAYVKNGNPAKIRMPLDAGDYEIRYVQGNNKVIARQSIRILSADATVSAKITAVAGETVAVTFTGPPAGAGDFITVTAPDANESAYNDYAYTKNDSPAKIRMPLDAGDYEIRYVQGNKKVIARQSIKVTAAIATLDAPAKAAVGETISVIFTGPPAGAGDFITVTAPDAEERAYNHYAYTQYGSPAKIKMPDTPGNFEIRYVQGNEKVIARRPIKIVATP